MLFISLLIGMAQPKEAGSRCNASSALDAAGRNAGSGNDTNANNGGGNTRGEEEEPNLDAIMKHEPAPAQTKIPFFLPIEAA